MIVAFDPNTGRILAVISAPDSHAAHYGEHVLLTADEAIDDSNHYVAGGLLIPIPAPPSRFYVWSWTTKSWSADLAAAKAACKAVIDTERARRNFLPITVNGIRLDADPTAQKNLSDKLQEVRERIRLDIPMPPQLLIWNDADNTIQVFPDLQTYHDWLARFTITLAQRGTMLYGTAWQHKAALDALTEIDAVLAYDVTVGWPE